jgi:hypothetical protein
MALLAGAKDKAKKTAAEKEAMMRLTTVEQLILEEESYSWPRRMAVKITTHGDFELVVILAIFANCITLALYNPLVGHGVGINAALDTAGEWRGSGSQALGLFALCFEAGVQEGGGEG